MKEVFETPEKADVEITTTRYTTIIDIIFKRNFVNTFHHQNVPNQCQYANKHTSKQYQPRYFQISKDFLSKQMKEKCIGCGLEKN